MRPLLFVNWARVAARFTALMWALVFILAVVVAAHLVGGATDGAHLASTPPANTFHNRVVSAR